MFSNKVYIMLELGRYGGLSPCNGICTYDENDQYCIGCFRTKYEITNWYRFDTQKQKDIIFNLGIRATKSRKHTKNKST